MVNFTLVGMAYAGVSVDDVVGYESVVLRPEPDNEYDPNAIMVLGVDHSGSRKLGYVTRDSNIVVSNEVYSVVIANPSPTGKAVRFVLKENSLV